MGTYGSFIKCKTHENTEINMATQESQIAVKPNRGPSFDVTRKDGAMTENSVSHQIDDSKLQSKNQAIILQNGVMQQDEVDKFPDDYSRNKDRNTERNEPMISDDQRPQRQTYVNNRTSKLYELTLPVYKADVDPESRKVINEIKSVMESAVNTLKNTDNIVNEEVLECVNTCRKFYCDERITLYRYILGQHLCDLGFPEIFCKLLNEFHKLNLFETENKLAVEIFRKLKAIAWNFTNVSMNFCTELGKAGIIPILLSSLSRKEFLPSKITEELVIHVKGSLGILSNMVRLSPDNRQLARKCDAVKVLLEYSKVEHIMLQAKCFIILSFLITTAEVCLLENTGSAIRFIVDLLKTSLESENGLARGFNTAEILLALNNLALHDKNKVKIVEYRGLTHLAVVLNLKQTPCNKEAVQILAAESTWKLSFIEENREKIKSENGLIDAITLLRSSANGKLKTACSGVLWETFEGIFEEADDTTAAEDHKRQIPHVMLSYQWDVQPRIILLKQKLQNAGYKVWMDIDQMGGDLLGAMASAVENSAVVLTCISQKYKDSTSCRTEATYAYKQNKPIIPLIVQPNYTADGWLGAFIGTLKYFPLYKDSMVATEFPNIKNEIAERGKLNSQIKDVNAVCVTDGPLTDKAHGGPVPNDVSKWTCKHVSEWLKRNKMCELNNVMKNVNGKLLIQMFKMSNKAPDFFYTRLERDFKMNNLMLILKFSSAIEELLE